MRSRIVTRVLALLCLLVFIFGIWSCRHAQDINKATKIDIAIHDKVSQNSRIVDIDFNRSLVQIETLDGPLEYIIFEADSEFFYFLKYKSSLVSILPVTFICDKKPDMNCDPRKPYTLYVATRKVKPIQVQKHPQK